MVVVGRRTRHVDEVEAAGSIAGYTVGNDVSVRDWQTTTSQMWLGKSYESHGPIGPWVVTRDEFDPAAATIRTWVNDELRQEGRLAEQFLSPAELVARIPEFCTLTSSPPEPQPESGLSRSDGSPRVTASASPSTASGSS